jgi:hypothetical protein
VRATEKIILRCCVPASAYLRDLAVESHATK